MNIKQWIDRAEKEIFCACFCRLTEIRLGKNDWEELKRCFERKHRMKLSDDEIAAKYGGEKFRLVRINKLNAFEVRAEKKSRR